MPETIVSRCQRFSFKRIPYEQMKKQLEIVAKEEKIKIDKEVIDRIIIKSDGCDRDAISLLDQLMATGEKNITSEIASIVLPIANLEKNIEFVDDLIKKNTTNALVNLNLSLESGTTALQFANDLLNILRIIMLNKVQAQTDTLQIELSDQTKKTLRKITDNIDNLALINLIDITTKRTEQIRTSPLPQLPLEMLVIEWTLTNSNDTNNTNTLQKEKLEVKNSKTEQIPETKENITEKKTIIEKVKEMVTPHSALKLEDVNAKWNEFVKAVELHYPTLSFILKMTNILGCEGNNLNLAVKYSFHKDKLTERPVLAKLEETFSNILQNKLNLRVVVIEEPEKNEQELQELATSIGGEVI